MNSATLRRLASDQASLRKSLPPNYLFPPASDSQALPDHLTQLLVLVTGAQGTPYSQGLWHLQLDMPHDYPKNPPRAAFKTRIYHPNVDESTGTICLDTLKRDWQPTLTLRDILMAISCLLIHPNPDSALNSTAGALLQEDYHSFAKKAALMTSIHAPIPGNLKDAVQEAKSRGESDRTSPPLRGTTNCPGIGPSRITSQSMKQEDCKNNGTEGRSNQASPQAPSPDGIDCLDFNSNVKENIPSRLPAPPVPAPLLMNSRKSRPVKRPFSDLPAAPDSGIFSDHTFDDANQSGSRSDEQGAFSSPSRRKSPRLDDSVLQRMRQPGKADVAAAAPAAGLVSGRVNEEKENHGRDGRRRRREAASSAAAANMPGSSWPLSSVPITTTTRAPSRPCPTLRKVMNVGPGRPRIGIRRL